MSSISRYDGLPGDDLWAITYPYKSVINAKYASPISASGRPFSPTNPTSDSATRSTSGPRCHAERHRTSTRAGRGTNASWQRRRVSSSRKSQLPCTGTLIGRTVSSSIKSSKSVLGAVAVVISLSQCLLGLFLVSSSSKGLLGQSGNLYAVINRLDGVKQLLLGATVVTLVILRRRGPTFPHWLRGTTVILGVALVPSGLAYLFLWNALPGTTFISLPLLVLWLAGTGVWLTRREPTASLSQTMP